MRDNPPDEDFLPICVCKSSSDQIFGAVSVLTNTERMASVRAKTDCLAVVFSKDQFLALASNKPDALLKLAEDLSRAIISINDHVVGSLKIPG